MALQRTCEFVLLLSCVKYSDNGSGMYHVMREECVYNFRYKISVGGYDGGLRAWN